MSPDSEDGRAAAVAAICSDALGEEPLSIRPIEGGGVVNAVFAVDTRLRRLVVRVQFDRPFEGAFRKEQWCMERARAVGVPGPEVVAIGTCGAHAYAIHTRIEGVVGSCYTGDVAHVWREIGHHAQRFHRVEALGFGEHLGGPLEGSSDTSLRGWVDWWDAYVFGTPLLVDYGLLSAVALDAARETVLQIREWSGAPRLCHGNLALDNVIVDARGDVHVLDWGTAAGHLAPHLDLSELHVWSMDPEPPALRPFLDGYGLSRHEYATLRDSLSPLEVWRVLSSARWALGTARPALIEFLRRKTRALALRFGWPA